MFVPSNLSFSLLSFTHFHSSNNEKKTKHHRLAKNLLVQQLLQPLDPLADPVVAGTRLDSEGDKDGQAASASQLSHPSELTLPSSTGNPPPPGRGGTPGTCRSGLCHVSIVSGCCSVPVMGPAPSTQLTHL